MRFQQAVISKIFYINVIFQNWNYFEIKSAFLILNANLKSLASNI